jgi:hypothetical protein
MDDSKLRGINPTFVIVDELASMPFPNLTQKQQYNCPADTKLIPFLVDGICRHWFFFTGGK